MNYALMNDWRNWNEWGHVIEAEYRNLSIVYPTKDNIVNTLAWEGVREAMDDVRYATLLRQLSRKAVQENNIQAKKIAHRAEAALAYFDAIRRDPEAFRMECANYILQLLQALNQERK